MTYHADRSNFNLDVYFRLGCYLCVGGGNRYYLLSDQIRLARQPRQNNLTLFNSTTCSSRSLISAGSSIPWVFPHLVDNVVMKVNDILTSNSQGIESVFREGDKGNALRIVASRSA
jgi:hypothetical protein